MELKGVHFILSYKCDSECDHCFVWGRPDAEGAFTLKQISHVLSEVRKVPTVNYISIEGGEPFLFYPLMIKTEQQASKLGLRVEVLSNCYWASCPEDAEEWLKPLSELNAELTLSSDLYHGDRWQTEHARNALKAAKALSMKTGIIAVKSYEAEGPCPTEFEGVKVGLCELMCKGRAFSKLPGKMPKKSWHEFTKCPYENFVKQERVHIDPFGYMHVCQGISIGNFRHKPLSRIVAEYNPYEHPIVEPLVRGGPVALVEKFGLPHDEEYADACHMCYAARLLLRDRYPDILGPDQMYGEFNSATTA